MFNKAIQDVAMQAATKLYSIGKPKTPPKGFRIGTQWNGGAICYKTPIVFRGDKPEPSLVFSQGFSSRGELNSLTAHMNNSSQSIYIPTTKNPLIGIEFAASDFENFKYLYKISTTAGLVIVNTQGTFNITGTAFASVFPIAGIDEEKIAQLLREAEYSVLDKIPGSAVKEVQAVQGSKNYHFIQIESQVNPDFTDKQFTIFIPSANDAEAQYVEDAARKGGQLKDGQRYLKAHEARILRDILNEYHAKLDNINSSPLKKEALVLFTVKDTGNTEGMIDGVRAQYDKVCKNNGGRYNMRFFNTGLGTKSPILDRLDAEPGTLIETTEIMKEPSL